MLSFRYSITREEYISFYTYVMWDAPEKKKARWKHYSKSVLINLTIIAVIVISGIFRYSPTSMYAYIAVLVFATVMQLVNARLNIRKQAEKIVNAPGNENLFIETLAEVSEAGIVTKDEHIESRYQWSAFVKKAEGPEFYLLFSNSLQSILFPKRIFRSATEKQEFEKMLARHLSLDAEVSNMLQ